jgi:GT2 family glycosyltransferase
VDVASALPEGSTVHQDHARLSVIITTYNRADQLRQQLDALCLQVYPQRWEVLVVDNRSTDHTLQMLQEYAARLPLRIVLATEQQGRPYAVNVGAAAARGDALIWLDSDDVIEPGYLLAMGRALSRHTFVGGRLDTIRLNPPWLHGRRRPVQESELPRLMGHHPFVVGAALGVRTDAFHEVGGCDEAMHSLEDVDLSWRLHDAGHIPVFVPDAIVHYRYRQDLRGIWQQERAYGRWEAALVVKHRELGLPPRQARTVLAGWAQILRAVASSYSRPGRARLTTATAAAVGRFEGSLRHRVLHL